MENLIKVADSALSSKLIELGFQYVKESEGNVIAFIQTDELMTLLQESYSNSCFICENKLRF